jgi:hypothetical protein
LSKIWAVRNLFVKEKMGPSIERRNPYDSRKDFTQPRGPMKLIPLLSFFLLSSVSFSALAEAKLICTAFQSKKLMKIAKEHSQFDKNLHCAVSCMLTLKCGPSETLLVGGLKEVRDLMGYGEPSVDDLKADMKGIHLAMKVASDNESCMSECDKIFAP